MDMSLRKLGIPRLTALLGVAVMGVLLWNSPLFGAEAPVIIPPPAVDNPKAAGPMQTAVLAGGCFWGVQAVFEHVRGVRKAIAGYAGGERSTADYRRVGTGTTGHAESVKIIFDPAKISYGQILQIAFSVVHDPTQLNRQGPDVGPQYRSVIFYADDQQKEIAQRYIEQLNQAKVFPGPIVTQLKPLSRFYPAEADHQNYLQLHLSEPYVVVNDLPKLKQLQNDFPSWYK